MGYLQSICTHEGLHTAFGIRRNGADLTGGPCHGTRHDAQGIILIPERRLRTVVRHKRRQTAAGGIVELHITRFSCGTDFHAARSVRKQFLGHGILHAGKSRRIRHRTFRHDIVRPDLYDPYSRCRQCLDPGAIGRVHIPPEISGNDDGVQRPVQFTLHGKVRILKRETAVAVAHAPRKPVAMTGETHYPMIEVHALRQLHNFPLVKNVHKEKHARSAAGERLHPFHVRRNNLFRKLQFKGLHFRGLRLGGLRLVDKTGMQNTFGLADHSA